MAQLEDQSTSSTKYQIEYKCELKVIWNSEQQQGACGPVLLLRLELRVIVSHLRLNEVNRL